MDLITKDEDLQVRIKLNDGTVKQYIEKKKSGIVFPPVRLAKVGDQLVLVDGWHRFAAFAALGETHIKAQIVTCTLTEAYWLAASANLTHGLPLKPGELRLVFRMYVKARKHLKGNVGAMKSYREISQEIGKPHTTIRNWMKMDFPKIAARMAGCDENGETGGLRHPEVEVLSDLEAAQRTVFETFRGSSDPSFRGQVIREVETLLSTMKASGGWTEVEIEEPDF